MSVEDAPTSGSSLASAQRTHSPTHHPDEDDHYDNVDHRSLLAPDGAQPTVNAGSPQLGSYSLRRYWILVMFSLLTSSNAIQWIMYATIPDAAKAAFGLNTSELNMLSSVYMIVFIPGFFVSCSVVERMSLRVCLMMGCLLNVAGAGLKLGLAVALPRYGVLIAAQCVLAVAQIFLLSAPPLVADEWFPPHQRAAATAIGSMANNVGIALGMLLAPLMVTQDTSATSHDFVGFLVLQLVLSAVPLLGIVHSALSASSPVAQDSTQMNNVEVENQYSDEDVTFRKGLPVRWLSCCAALTASRDAVTAIFSLLRENHSYRWLLASCSITIGVVWAMFILQAQVLGAFSLSSASIGRLGAAQCGVGAIAASVLLTLWFCRRGGGMGVDSNADHAVFSRSKEEIRKLLIVSTCVTFASFSLLYLLLLTMFPNTTEDNAVMSAWRAAATSDQVMTVASYVLFSSIASISQCVSIALFFVLSTIAPTVVVEHGGPVADTTSGAQPQATMHRLLLGGGAAVALFLVLFGSYLLKPSLNNNSGISSTTASPESAINTVTFLLRFGLLPGFLVHGI